jgi:hypothetical protein
MNVNLVLEERTERSSIPKYFQVFCALTPSVDCVTISNANQLGNTMFASNEIVKVVTRYIVECWENKMD